MTLRSGGSAPLTGDLSSVPRTHAGRLITTFNSSSRRTGVSNQASPWLAPGTQLQQDMSSLAAKMRPIPTVARSTTSHSSSYCACAGAMFPYKRPFPLPALLFPSPPHRGSLYIPLSPVNPPLEICVIV